MYQMILESGRLAGALHAQRRFGHHRPQHRRARGHLRVARAGSQPEHRSRRGRAADRGLRARRHRLRSRGRRELSRLSTAPAARRCLLCKTDARHAPRPPAAVRPALRGDPRRVQRSRQVGQLAGPRRAARRAPPPRLPGQPKRRRGARRARRTPRSPTCRRRPELVVIAVPAAGFEQAVDDVAGGRRAGDRRHHRRARRGRRRGGTARTGAGRAGARGRRDAARPQLPGRVRRHQRPRPGVERVPARLDRPDLPERQPGARAGHPGPAATGSASRALPRSATRPTSTWPSWSRRSRRTRAPS